jgi:hypothetical protein
MGFIGGLSALSKSFPGRDERRGTEQRATRRTTEATGYMYMTVTSAYDYASHAEPQGFIIRPLLPPTNKVVTEFDARWVLVI